MTMFKLRTSMSPVKAISPEKRAHESNHVDRGRPSKVPKLDEPRFTFDEVKQMIERLLAQGKCISTTSMADMLRKVDFNECAIAGHTVQGCQELLEKLIKNTRRTRTMFEILEDINKNLDKKVYTEIIQRATIEGKAPKRPASAYLLFHQDRYNQLKHEYPLAADVAKIVSEEWKNLSDHEKQIYHDRHDELMEQYHSDMKRLGLVDLAPPKRPGTARTLYIARRMKKLRNEPPNSKKVIQAKEKYGNEFDNLDDEEKKRWAEELKVEKEKYKQEKEAYIAKTPHLNHTVPDRPQRAKEPKVKPPHGPLSALKFYLQKKMPENLSGQEADETKKRLKEKFQSLSEKKLLKFIKKAIKDQERYEEELKEFKAAHPDIEVPKTKPSISKEQWKLYMSKVENRPTIPAPTAYLFYCGKMMSDMHSDDANQEAPTQRMQAASIAWRNANERERKAVEAEHKESIREYIKEMEAWLADQTESRKQKLFAEEPKANPDYWRRKINRLNKADRANKSD